MIGARLKKYAQENGMTVDKGVAYGSFHGFCTTISEGAGYIQMVISTRFEVPSKQDAFRTVVEQENLPKQYRVQNMAFAPNGINIVFQDNPGTMKKVEAFVAWFMPLLEQYGASKAEICPECGMPVENGTWILRNGVVASYVHGACAEKVMREVEAGNEQRKEEDTGSYGKGFVGAFLGMLVGAVAWAIVYALGFVASLAGFVTGWMANLLYDKFHGKQGKGKIAILIFVVILGVVLGTFAGLSISLAIPILNGEWDAVYTLADVPALILTVMIVDASARISVIKDVLLGLLFAGLGVFTLLRNAGRQVADEKVVVLK